MQIKDEIRQEIKEKRRHIENKSDLDSAVCANVINSHIFKNADTILCYSALRYEILTDEIRKRALVLDKTVALPYCTDKNGNMQFYIIKSFDDLKQGSFGISEPDTDKCKLLQSFNNAIIIVPGLCFSTDGRRLGYGKGYYDRFLQNNYLISFGLCYNTFIRNYIPVGEFDKSVDFVITEDSVINCKADK